jgi:succinate--hydroxymethylglutarate CoA-transferase
MISAGNDGQFATLCAPAIFDRAEWLNDSRFSTNAQRVGNRETIITLIEEVLRTRTTEQWCARLLGKG